MGGRWASGGRPVVATITGVCIQSIGRQVGIVHIQPTRCRTVAALAVACHGRVDRCRWLARHAVTGREVAGRTLR